MKTIRMTESLMSYVNGHTNLFDDVLAQLVADNVLWFGTVAEPPFDQSTRAVRKFNDHVLADDRVDVVTLTIGDGVMLIRKRR
ncbi:O-methyltransferase [Nocardia sp. NPDC055053]